MDSKQFLDGKITVQDKAGLEKCFADFALSVQVVEKLFGDFRGHLKAPDA